MRLAARADRLVDALQRQVGERVGAELRGDVRRPSRPWAIISSLRRHVDPVVARVADRRRGHPQVDLGRARLAQHAARSGASCCRARSSRPRPPAACRCTTSGSGLNFMPQAVAAQLLPGLDERARDVAVLDQAVVLRDPGAAREALRRGVAGVGHGDHEVGLDRRLAGEDLAHPAAHRLERAALELRVGPREVDVLEHAQRRPLGLDRLARLDAALADRDQLAGLRPRASACAPMMSSAQLSEATT